MDVAAILINWQWLFYHFFITQTQGNYLAGENSSFLLVVATVFKLTQGEKQKKQKMPSPSTTSREHHTLYISRQATFFSTKIIDIFLISPLKYVVGTH